MSEELTNENMEAAAEETVKDTVENVVSNVEEVGSSFLETAEETVADAVEVAEEVTSEVSDAVETVATEVVEGASDAVESATEVVDEVVESVEATAEKVAESAEEAIDTAEEVSKEAVDVVSETTEAMLAESNVETSEEVVADVSEVATVEETSVAKPEYHDPKHIGYTGEIEGKVYSLDELETLEDEEQASTFGAILEQHEATISNIFEQDIVTGTVVRIGEKEVVIDIGFKSDGILSKSEFDDPVSEGETVDVYLEKIEDRHGQLVLSRRRAVDLRRWQSIEDAHEGDKILEGTIIRRIKGGMIVDILGKEAFLPGSQIDVRPVRDFDSYLNKVMEFKVVKLNPTNGNVVVSHKALIEKDLEQQRGEILEKMEPGQVLEGTVKNITDFGVFIDLGGVDGLLHITDLSWGRVSHPAEVVSLDEKINVVVLEYDKERQRISLGLKQLQKHPWDEITEKYNEGDKLEGKVVSITDYGAFVELEKGIEGLVHISEMSWTQHVKHPTQVVQMGEMVQVQLLNIDTENRKISLGMKQLQEDPWTSIQERYPPGTVTKGYVRNLTNFGVFVEIEAGVDGLVHVSDLSWTKKIRHPGEIIKKDQEIDVVVLDIDEENRRLSLGHKQVETNPWNQFSTAYAEGTRVTSKVIRFNENGIIVELPLEVEAFIPASHLAKSSANLENAYKVGDVLEVEVIEFSVEDKKIILSEKLLQQSIISAQEEAEAAEERKAEEKARQEVDSFISGQASGPATMGELSQLATLKAKMEAAEAEDAIVTSEAPVEAEVQAEETADETTDETTEETVVQADDLKKIEGIGPKIAELLTNAGLNTYEALAAQTPEAIKEILTEGGSRYASHDPTTWPQQASYAAAGKWDELKEWQDSLQGGKVVE